MSCDENCVLGARNEQRIIGLEKRTKEVEDAILDMRDRLLNRPSWTVVTIISILTAISSVSMGCVLRMMMG